MAPNNIEKQIKEKLHSREIKPSEMAWDRLDAMLSVAEEKKTKRSFGWLYIAASILVLLTAGTFFFTQKNTEITPNNSVVNQEVAKDSVIKSQPQIHEGIAPVEKIQPLVQVEKNTSQPATNHRQSATKNKVSIIKSNQSIAHQSTTIQHNQSVNQSQKEEIIAQQQGQNNLNINLSEIDKTIPIEIKEVIAQNESKATTSSKVTVSANSLLSQVDGELDLTFREKVFKKVTKNYKEVKVVVVNRNNLK